MRTYQVAALPAALRAAGVRPGDVVCVHSALFALGRPSDAAVAELPAALGEALLDYLGPRGTLVAPAFTFAFCRGEPFDRQATPSAGMGQLSEWVRTRPGAVRSPHPMQSVSALGLRAEEICAGDPPSAFDEDGAFARMEALDARLLLLGCRSQAASFIHLAEQRAAVPYRYWKTFRGEYRDGGASGERAYRMYVRDEALDPRLVVAPVEAALRADGLWGEAPLGSGRVESCGAREFAARAERMLRDDPFCLVTNPPAPSSAP